jgi:predicted Zn-dependent protease
MTSTPDRRRRAAPALAKALAVAALLIGSAGPGRAGSLQQAGELIAAAREDLSRGDGIAAEVRLKQAMAQGAVHAAVAAYMGEALIAQNELDKARKWLAPGIFTRQTAPLGFRMLARLEQLQGNLAAAGSAFDRVIGLTPRDATMWVEIGRLRYAGGEHMLALDAANYALSLDPGNVRVLELRGQIVRDQYGLAAALPWFEAALAKAPEDVSVLGEYAATLGELGRAREMLTVTRRMLELDPGNPRAFYLQAVMAARAGNAELARGLLSRTGNELEDMPAAMLLEGVLELRAGNYVLATEAFERLLRRQPFNQKARLLLARALFLSGEHRQLVIRFAEAGADPNASPYLLTTLARAHEILGERQLAAPLLDRAARPRSPLIAVVALGTPAGMLVADGQMAEAEATAEQARTVNPGSFDTQALAGDVQLAMGRGASALERYRLAARVRLPESLMLRMVAAHRLAGQPGEAAALTEAYLLHNPTSEAAARLAAQLAADAGDWKRARLLLERIRSSGAERDLRLLTDLSLAQLRSGDASAAEASAREAYRLQRANPLAAQAWGLSLAALGEKPRIARALLDKARLLQGDNPLLAEGRQRLAENRKG